jgi:hypothetical protein
MRFRIKVDQTGRVEPPVLTQEQLNDIGETMVRNQKERWTRGVNALDQQARPLAPVTAKGKVTYGKRPIRDMEMTGVVRENFTLRKATMTEILAENTSVAGRMHARKAQKFERMIGLAPSERTALFLHAQRAYSIYLKRAWKKETP